MKNIIISILGAYIFWTDFCVIHPTLLILPMVFILFWMILAGIDDLVDDFMRSVRRGNKLNRTINRMKGDMY